MEGKVLCFRVILSIFDVKKNKCQKQFAKGKNKHADSKYCSMTNVSSNSENISLPDNKNEPTGQIPKTNEQTFQKMDPGLVQLAQIIKEGFIENQNIEIQGMKIETKDRITITIAITIAIVIIILAIVYLTMLGKFEMSTLAFLLGTSVGSLLTILGKHLTG